MAKIMRNSDAFEEHFGSDGRERRTVLNACTVDRCSAWAANGLVNNLGATDLCDSDIVLLHPSWLVFV
jgi:hypothetical protein